MQVKKLCDLKTYEVGVIERVDTPEEVMALVQMGCCIGSEVEVKHIAPLNGPMAICTCGFFAVYRTGTEQYSFTVYTAVP